MTKTVYRPWRPVDNLPTVLFCEALHDDYEHLRVLLKGEGDRAQTLRVLFEDVVAYRNINESYRLRTWNSLTSRLPSLLIVEGSAWIRWLKEESAGTLSAVDVTHYAIYTPEDCIDIASTVAPDVRWLNE